MSKKQKKSAATTPKPTSQKWLSLSIVGLLIVAAASMLLKGTADAPTEEGKTKVYGYRVVNKWPHDDRAYTQGLIYMDGYFYESTGKNGRSSVRKVEPKTGKVVHIKNLDEEYFGEGLTYFNGGLIQLTWQGRKGFVWDKESFDLIREFHYNTEGWGLTHDGTWLIVSDGTSELQFIDPETFALHRKIRVMDQGRPVKGLNELEYIKGEIWANVYQTDYLVRVSPEDGKVLSWVNLTGILKPDRLGGEDVLNGIAYDAERDRIFVTGKFYAKLYQIKLK